MTRSRLLSLCRAASVLLYTGLVFYSASLYTATVNTVKDTVEDAVKDNDYKDSIEDSDEARVVRLHQQCEVLKQQVQRGGCTKAENGRRDGGFTRNNSGIKDEICSCYSTTI